MKDAFVGSGAPGTDGIAMVATFNAPSIISEAERAVSIILTPTLILSKVL